VALDMLRSRKSRREQPLEAHLPDPLKAFSVQLQKRRLTVFTGVNPSPPRELCGPPLGSIIGPGLVGVVVALCRLRGRRQL
jgi:hypothetical protein